MKSAPHPLLSTALAILLMLGVSGCSQSKKSGKETAQAAPAEARDTSASKEMNLRMFRTLVYDYKANPEEWAFRGQRPAIIDFYATWCGPCKMTAPILERLAEKYHGRMDVYKVDVDRQQELASMFGISSIPSFLFIPIQGQPVMRIGALTAEEFEGMIQETLLLH